jgi:hypothetical protein
MTEQPPAPRSSSEPGSGPTAYVPPAPQPYGSAPPPPAMTATGPVGQIRGTGFAIAIYILTFGIYGYYWYYKVHKEMKDHSGQGIGGGIALLLALVVGIAMPYVTANEVGNLHVRRGQQAPVSAATGLWAFPGALILVGPIIWFVKTNRALNDYWASLGAVRP